MNNVLEVEDSATGEEVVEGCATSPMLFVADGGEHDRYVQGVVKDGVLVETATDAVNLVVVVRVSQVDLVGGDSHHRAVSVVQLFDLAVKVAIFDHVPVPDVKSRYRREKRAWDGSQRVEKASVDESGYGPEK